MCAAGSDTDESDEEPEVPATEASDAESSSTVGVGYVIDYISGRRVRATPEERDAVQVFARRLVEDYGYPKDWIQTRPQFRVRKRPSDKAKGYPVDIAVFSSASKVEAELSMVVECKQKKEKDGEEQLKLYLDMSPATLGVWFNGSSHLYLQKVHHKDGSRTYRRLPNIPLFGQRVEDIGLYKRKDLVQRPSNLRAIFRDLRNHLAGMVTGVTRDEPLAREIINLLFCKLYDERDTKPNEVVRFRAGVDETESEVLKRIEELFEEVKVEYADVFDDTDVIQLDARSVSYVVGELQTYEVGSAERDAIGDAFETFIGPALRGAEGQFFTPRNVVRMAVELLDPKPGERIIDPACGSGGFLIGALEHVWQALRSEAADKNWSERQLIKQEDKVATDCFRGIDKDSFLSKVTKAYMALVGDGRGGVFCENSLRRPAEWSLSARDKCKLGTFDIVITNPPFGKKIVVEGEELLAQYQLGRKWRSVNGEWEQTEKLHDRRPPQVLFVERCLQLLRPGGRMAIVLPESLLGMPTHEYVVNFVRLGAKIRGIVSMPEELFKTSGKGGTHTKVCLLLIERTTPKEGDDWPVFMASAQWCGHDSRGNSIFTELNGDLVPLDDIPQIVQRFKELFGTADQFWSE